MKAKPATFACAATVNSSNAAGIPVAGTTGDTSADTKIGDWYSAYTLRFGYSWDRTLAFAKVAACSRG